MDEANWKTWDKIQVGRSLGTLEKREASLNQVGSKQAAGEGGTARGPKKVVRYPGWREVVFTVDSGATETVMGLQHLSGLIPVVESRTSAGATYECANGGVIENHGERRFRGTVFGGKGDGRGITRGFCAQVTDVNKPLLSVGRLEAKGYRVTFNGPDKSFITDGKTGERMKMEKRGHVYVLRVWVKENEASGFTRQGKR